MRGYRCRILELEASNGLFQWPESCSFCAVVCFTQNIYNMARCIFGNLFAVVVLRDWHVSCLAGKAWIAQKCSTLHLLLLHASSKDVPS